MNGVFNKRLDIVCLFKRSVRLLMFRYHWTDDSHSNIAFLQKCRYCVINSMRYSNQT